MYTKFWKPSPNYTPAHLVPSVWGRKRTIEKIAIHWWGDPKKNPSFEGVVNVLTNPKRQASAHYVATGTGHRVAQLVQEKDASWATNSANPFTISIECDPRARADDYEVVAELIADIWKRHGKIGLVPHRNYAPTVCPGVWDLNRLYKLAEKKLTPPVPKSVKLPKVIKYRTKSGARLVDIAKGKTIKTFKAGEVYEAYAKIVYQNRTYYVTKYSHSKGIKNGVVSSSLYTKPPKPPAPSEPEYKKNLVRYKDDKTGYTVAGKLIEIPTGKTVGGFEDGTEIQIAAQTAFKGKTYYITRYSLDKGIWNGITGISFTPPAPPEPPKDDPTDDDNVEGKDRFNEIPEEVTKTFNAFIRALIDWLKKLIGKG